MNYYNEIKTLIVDNEVYKKVKDYSKNRNDLRTYYEIGKILSEAGKHYGEGIIKEYSRRLTKELGKGYSKRNLWLMLKFYNLNEKMQTLSAQISWSHYCELLQIELIDEINYYIMLTKEENLSVRQLRTRIKNRDYERLPENTKNNTINKEEKNVVDFIKNPIIINNKNNYEIITEKVLQKIIVEDIELFMKELGNLFCFIGSEYKIKLGNNYNYIDILLFNIEFNCYVVVELKVTELKKEHIGQIQIYMNYIDKKIKNINHNKSIGIILTRKDNKFVMEYCSDERIIAKEYILI